MCVCLYVCSAGAYSLIHSLTHTRARTHSLTHLHHSVVMFHVVSRASWCRAFSGFWRKRSKSPPIPFLPKIWCDCSCGWCEMKYWMKRAPCCAASLFLHPTHMVYKCAHTPTILVCNIFACLHAPILRFAPGDQVRSPRHPAAVCRLREKSVLPAPRSHPRRS